MKTPEEIKKGLETHKNHGICMVDCPYDAPVRCGYSCSHELASDALAYIQQLEASYRQLSKTLCGKENATLEELLRGASQVKAELEATKRERDAAAADAAIGQSCDTCLYGKNHPLTNPCMACGGYHNLWKWRGVYPENTEVQE